VIVQNVIALIAGALFAAGVCVSGMVRPSKVLAFLDLGGRWDASLLIVMASALAIQVTAWRSVRGRRAPRYGTSFPAPPSPRIDLRLFGGATLFGVGWGLSGYCPGPAILAVLSGTAASFVFLGAVAATMLAFDHVVRSSNSDG
jgi:uncharacterized protein